MKCLTILVLYIWSASCLAQLPEDSNWDSTFASFASEGSVNVIAKIDTEIYVGGTFTSAGNKPAWNIAMWDGHTWHALGAGVQPTVNAIAIQGDDVYVGGSFRNAGSVPGTSGVARWSRSQKKWFSIGNGVSLQHSESNVYALAIIDSTLVVGGNFIRVGDSTSCASLAIWNGSEWNSWFKVNTYGDNGAFTKSVFALHEKEGVMYIGGDFSTLNGIYTPGFAAVDSLGVRVDRVINWASGVREVRCLASDDSLIYLGGTFQIKSINQKNIYAFNTSTERFRPFTNGTDGTVLSFTKYKDRMLIGGEFKKIDTLASPYLALCDGTVLSPLLDTSMYPDLSVRALFHDSSRLYVGGTFGHIGGINAFCVASAKDDVWYALGAGLGGRSGINTIVKDKDGNIYIGGQFSRIDTFPIRYIGKYNRLTKTWEAIGGGVNGKVFQLLYIDDNLYAVGNFTLAGNKSVGHIARWDGSTWQRIGDSINNGTDGFISCIAVDKNNTIYIGGNFFTVGGKSISCLAKFEDNEWSTVGGAVMNSPTSLLFVDDTLYVGDLSVEKWDKSSWYSLGTGLAWGVECLLYHNGLLYAGGWFTVNNDTSIKYLAAFDGTTWNRVCENPNSAVIALQAEGSVLYLGGAFTQIGNTPINHIAKCNLNTGNVTSLGSGVDAWVWSLFVNNNELYVGGEFTKAGGKPSVNLAKWNRSFDKVNPIQNNQGSINIFPSIISDYFTLVFDLKRQTDASISITDYLGRTHHSENVYVSAGTQLIKVERLNISPGYYFVQIQSRDWCKSFPVCVLASD